MPMGNQNWSRPENTLARLRKEFATAVHDQGGRDTLLQVPQYLRGIKPSLLNPHIVSLGPMKMELGAKLKLGFYRIFHEWYVQAHEEFAKVKFNFRSLNPFSTSLKGSPMEHFVEALELKDSDVAAAGLFYRIDGTAVPPLEISLIKHFLVMDTLFLVLFLRYSYQNSSNERLRLPQEVYEEISQVHTFRSLIPGIWKDAFLLENQIPMPILRKVWLQMPDKRSSPDADKYSGPDVEEELNSLLREVLKDHYLEIWSPSTQDGVQSKKFLTSVLNKKDLSRECDHLLDALHYLVSYSPPELKQEDNAAYRFVDEKVSPAPADFIPNVMRLQRVGIKVKADCTFIHEVKFDRRFPLGSPVLHLPRLRLADNSEAILRNLAVFEMLSCQQPGTGRHRQAVLIPFLILVDRLIQCKGDARLMTKEDIIVPCLGSNKETVSICKTLVSRLRSCNYQNSRWDDMIAGLMARYRCGPRRLFAEFRTRYFARPWVVLSCVASVLLLVLTGLQTLFTILAYRQNRFIQGPPQPPPRW